MNYLKFFLSNTRILLFGIALTFFSGFGQTFVLSLYIPDIISEFKISTSYFSAIYAGATLCSGLTLVFYGKLIDRMPLMKFTSIVIVGIIIANIFAGLSVNLIMIFFAIFMLRFFGQGLLSHTSLTAMGRYFSHSRGKALSLAQLGYPMAEMLFPISAITLIMVIGWRESFLISALFILVFLPALAWYLIRNFKKEDIVEDKPKLTSQGKTSLLSSEETWGQKQIIRNGYFYLFAPSAFLVGFIQTALFYFQTFIAGDKGWSVEWMALSITAYAIATSVFSLFSGALIDRFSARKLFPFVVLPLAAALVVLAIWQQPAVAMIMWFLTGITAGANPTCGNAMYAETYGVKNLGSIRSVFAFVMITSTAAGPLLYSFLLDRGFTFDHIHLMLAVVILLNSLYVYKGLRIMDKKTHPTT
jgi:MFS family permease